MQVSAAAVHARQHKASENHVLRFILAEAPLVSSTLEMKVGTSSSAAQGAAGHVHATPTAGADEEEDGGLRDAPVLEYASDVESEDDYIDSEVAAQLERSLEGSSSNGTKGSESAARDDIEENESAVAEQMEPAALPTLEDDLCEADAREVDMTAAVVQERTLVEEDRIIAASDTKPVDPHLDTASSYTDSEGGSSDDWEHAVTDHSLPKEVEEEPQEQPECAAADTVSDVKLSSRAPDLPVATSSDNASVAPTHQATGASGDREIESADHLHDHPDESRSESGNQSEDGSASAQPRHQDFAEPLQEASTTEDDGDDSSPEGSPKKPKKNHVESAPTIFEIAFVSVVALGIALYLVATVYAFSHPIFLSPPSLESLQTPMDLSNVSVVITSPANESLVEQPLYFEWQLVDYPIAAISKYGPEVFEYKVFVNEKRVMSEIGLLNTSIIGVAAEDVDHMLGSEQPGTFSTTVRHRIAAHHLPDFAKYELRVEVVMPIPGSVGAVHRMQERVFATKAFDVSKKLELLSPQDGSTFALGETVVVEYRASNVKMLEVLVDRLWRIEKQHIGDGNLLLRGLGAGQHTVELLGLDSSGRRVLTRDGKAQKISIQVFG